MRCLSASSYEKVKEAGKYSGLSALQSTLGAGKASTSASFDGFGAFSGLTARLRDALIRFEGVATSKSDPESSSELGAFRFAALRGELLGLTAPAALCIALVTDFDFGGIVEGRGRA